MGRALGLPNHPFLMGDLRAKFDSWRQKKNSDIIKVCSPSKLSAIQQNLTSQYFISLTRQNLIFLLKEVIMKTRQKSAQKEAQLKSPSRPSRHLLPEPSVPTANLRTVFPTLPVTRQFPSTILTYRYVHTQEFPQKEPRTFGRCSPGAPHTAGGPARVDKRPRRSPKHSRLGASLGMQEPLGNVGTRPSTRDATESLVDCAHFTSPKFRRSDPHLCSSQVEPQKKLHNEREK